MKWAIAVAVALAALVAGIFLAWKRRGRPRSQGIQQTLPVEAPPEILQLLSLPSATETLSRVRILRDRQAQWDEILTELNPTGDQAAERLLIAIRGPHLFAPHLGLGVIEDGCRRALASSATASLLDCLKEAAESQDPFVR